MKRYYESVIISEEVVAFFYLEKGTFMKNNKLLKLILAALFLALSYIMPYMTGQIPENTSIFLTSMT